jgi:hypothetical protein
MSCVFSLKIKHEIPVSPINTIEQQPQVIKFTSCFPMVSLGTPASSTTKTGRHDIQNVAEILLKVTLKHQK